MNVSGWVGERVKDKTLLLLPVGTGMLTMPWPRAGTGVISLSSPRLPAQTSPQHTHTHTHTDRHIVSVGKPFPDCIACGFQHPAACIQRIRERIMAMKEPSSYCHGLRILIAWWWLWIQLCFQDCNGLRLAGMTRALSYEGRLLTVCSAPSYSQRTENNYPFKLNWGFL